MVVTENTCMVLLFCVLDELLKEFSFILLYFSFVAYLTGKKKKTSVLTEESLQVSVT